MRKKQALLFTVVIGIVALYSLSELFDGVYTIFPTKSAPKKLMLACYSGNCKHLVVSIKQYNKQGEFICSSELAIVNGITEQQVQKYSLPEMHGDIADFYISFGEGDLSVPVVHFDEDLQKSGILVYICGRQDQYVYVISGAHQRVFYKQKDAAVYQEVTDAPKMKKLPPLHPHDGSAILPKPPSDWKSNVWVTT